MDFFEIFQAYYWHATSTFALLMIIIFTASIYYKNFYILLICIGSCCLWSVFTFAISVELKYKFLNEGQLVETKGSNGTGKICFEENAEVVCKKFTIQFDVR